MDTTPSTAGPDTSPDPNQDRSGAPMPARIAEILPLIQTLAAHGRRIADLITRPTAWVGFIIVARLFGTAMVPDIAAQIQRGLMRLSALEAMLLRRAHAGTDLVIPAAPKPGPRKARRATKPPEQETFEPQTEPLTLDSLPTQQEVEAWVRRRPIGRAIAAIILDLGIAPTLCQGTLWNQLSAAMKNYRGSVTEVIKEVRRRVGRFESEEWTQKTFPWPEPTREGTPRVLGLFIGQEPTAAATGPS